MVARVFATVQEKEKHKAAEVEISGRVPRPAGVVNLGGSGAKSDNTEQSGNWKVVESVVFAYQLLKIEVLSTRPFLLDV